jgi:hypothetical protein
VFCDESYNASPHDLALFVIVILKQLNIKKIKLIKVILKKIIRKKNHVESHCSNPQCFVRKATVLSQHD